MNDLAKAIRADLAVHTGILTYIHATDIYWMDAPAGSSLNRIVFKKISDPPLYDSDDKWQRWRFYVNHTDKYKCQDLKETLDGYLHRKNDDFNNVAISYVSRVDSGSDADPNWLEDIKAYQCIVDYMIYFIGS